MIIYKINIKGCDKCYIGSTKNFNTRMYQHIDYSKHYFNPKIQLYYIIREYGGWSNCEMTIIEENSTLEREKYWINYYGNVININQPTGMNEETKKERIKINSKKYYDKLISNEERKEKLKQYYKDYHKRKKETLNKC